MPWLIILLLTCLTTNFAIAYDSTATLAKNNPYREGAKLYVWVASLNLRQQASASAPVIKKLAYGTPVTVLKQDEKPVPYKLHFFSYKDSADAIPQNGEQGQVILDSEWLKVTTEQQEQGYVVNKLLLDIEPMPMNGVRSVDYLVHVFKLTKHQKKTTRQKEKECEKNQEAITVHETFTADSNKIVLKTEEIDHCVDFDTTGGAISIPNFPFDSAFVFFNAFLPPEPVGFTYQANKIFDYGIDQVGNSATLKKTKNGIQFEWYDGGD
jgi:hypothetical protein